MQKEAADSYRRARQGHEAAARTAKALCPECSPTSRFAIWSGSGISTGDDRSRFARELVQLVDRLGDKYQVDELAAKYEFTGRTPMTVPQALEVKEELETIDRLLKQLEEAARRRRRSASSTWTSWPSSPSRAKSKSSTSLQKQIEEIMRQMAEQQGLERGPEGYQLTPQGLPAVSRQAAGADLQQSEASRTGRHQGPIVGEGAVEMQHTKQYEFGDSVANMDMPASLINAMIRGGTGLPMRMKQEDIEIHRTRNTPKCATAVLMDMSGSMRYGGHYVHVKRMALALDGLIRREYPGDFLQFVEMYTFAKPVRPADIVSLMPKPVTVFDPVVRLRADMSREDMSEYYIPPHFTNIQHALQMGRQFLATAGHAQPAVHPDHRRAAHGPLRRAPPVHDLSARPREHRGGHAARGAALPAGRASRSIFSCCPVGRSRAKMCSLPIGWPRATKGRVFFTAGRDLDRYVVWDYLNRRREILA